MILARRRFIKSSLIFSASAFLLSESAPSGFARNLFDDGPLSDEVLRDPSFSFTRETFEPYVGGYFEVIGARGETVALKLLKVDPYVPPQTKLSLSPAVETDSFSLQFNAEAPLPPFQSIHHIKHGALGEFNLFLTRRDGPNKQIFYEAVFNRLH